MKVLDSRSYSIIHYVAIEGTIRQGRLEDDNEKWKELQDVKKGEYLLSTSS